ncbi:MAG: hypothetical protein WCI03_13885 [bacterium]
MNTLILNRAYALPEDGWYHIAPLGEFPHDGAGVTQVIDQEACIAMAARFAADANNDQNGCLSAKWNNAVKITLIARKYAVLKWCRSTDLNRDTREGGRF